MAKTKKRPKEPKQAEIKGEKHYCIECALAVPIQKHSNFDVKGNPFCADDVVIISSTQNGTRFTFSTESYEQLKRLAKHAMSETVKIGARRNADR